MLTGGVGTQSKVDSPTLASRQEAEYSNPDDSTRNVEQIYVMSARK